MPTDVLGPLKARLEKGRRSRQTALEEDCASEQRQRLDQGDYLHCDDRKSVLGLRRWSRLRNRWCLSRLSPQQQQNQLLQPVAISRLPTCCTARTGTRMESGLPAQAPWLPPPPPATIRRGGREGMREAWAAAGEGKPTFFYFREEAEVSAALRNSPVRMPDQKQKEKQTNKQKTMENEHRALGPEELDWTQPPGALGAWGTFVLRGPP